MEPKKILKNLDGFKEKPEYNGINIRPGSFLLEMPINGRIVYLNVYVDELPSVTMGVWGDRSWSDITMKIINMESSELIDDLLNGGVHGFHNMTLIGFDRDGFINRKWLLINAWVVAVSRDYSNGCEDVILTIGMRHANLII